MVWCNPGVNPVRLSGVKFCEIHFEMNQIIFLIIGPQTDNNGIAGLLNFDNECTPTTYSIVPTCCTWQ